MLSSVFKELNRFIVKGLQKPHLTSLLRTSSRAAFQKVTIEKFGSTQTSVQSPIWWRTQTCVRVCTTGLWIRALHSPPAYNIKPEDDFESSRRMLFVGGVTPEMNKTSIQAYFSNFSDVETVNMLKNLGGQQKRYCFVKLKDAESIEQILKMNHILGEQPLFVLRAKTHRVVFVDNLSSSLSFDQLKRHFSWYGSVEKVEIVEDPHLRQRKGYGYVTFSSQDEAAKAVKQQEHEIGSCIVKVKFPGSQGADIKTVKILVENLPFETSVEDVKAAFAKFDGLKLIDLAIRDDSKKCVAFLTFNREDIVDRLVQIKDLVIGESVVAMKKEIPRPEIGIRLRTVHVGNLPDSITEIDLMKYFSNFGKVYKVVLPLNVSGKNKGFAIVKFERSDSPGRVTAQPSHVLHNANLLVRRLGIRLYSQ